MVRLALASESCASLSSGELVRKVASLGFQGIEWCGHPHVPEGDRNAAMAVMMETLRAGLTVASYAPRYQLVPEVGSSADFSPVLATALTLNAPLIRLRSPAWCRASCDPSLYRKIRRMSYLSELKRLADMAGEKGVTLALSLGDGAALAGPDGTEALARDLDHPFLRLAWEEGRDDDGSTRELLSHSELFVLLLARRTADGHSLDPNCPEWRKRLSAFSSRPGHPSMGHFIVLSGSEDAAVGDLEHDAQTLRLIVEEALKI